MDGQERPPARYIQDQFTFTPWGVRVSELTDAELLDYDPSRSPKPDPPPSEPPDVPAA
ncbi:hypothetical protein [Amycolatopsis vancoresmycina]|uniref:hypothetical protein n=1 Tax=Amycolatopsis vancoresmycina TaxID=208444 RepID=UPI0003A6A797|nr:hypothetical protein [Amycolatopsis vancoresmycina]